MQASRLEKWHHRHLKPLWGCWEYGTLSEHDGMLGSMYGIYANIWEYTDGICYHIWHTYGSVMGMFTTKKTSVRYVTIPQVVRRDFLVNSVVWGIHLGPPGKLCQSNPKGTHCGVSHCWTKLYIHFSHWLQPRIYQVTESPGKTTAICCNGSMYIHFFNWGELTHWPPGLNQQVWMIVWVKTATSQYCLTWQDTFCLWKITSWYWVWTKSLWTSKTSMIQSYPVDFASTS